MCLLLQETSLESRGQQSTLVRAQPYPTKQLQTMNLNPLPASRRQHAGSKYVSQKNMENSRLTTSNQHLGRPAFKLPDSFLRHLNPVVPSLFAHRWWSLLLDSTAHGASNAYPSGEQKDETIHHTHGLKRANKGDVRQRLQNLGFTE